jgi:O-antigen ligase
LTGRVPVRPLMIWGAGFLLVSIAWYFPSLQDATAYQEIQTRILSVIFLLLVLFFCSRPEEQRLARVWIALTTLFSVGLCIYEVFKPLTFSKIPGRSAALFENANQIGSALVLGLIVSYEVVPRKCRIPFVILIGIAVTSTFSRSAMMGWIIVVAFFAIRGGLGARQMRAILILATVVLGLLVSPFWGEMQMKLEERGVLDLENVQRLAFFSQGTTEDASANERMAVAHEAWRLYTERPLFGYGTGWSRNIPGFDVGTHNIYLAHMVDHGVLGLFIVPLLLVAALWGVNKKTFDVWVPYAVFVLMWGLFSHNVLDERYILLSVSLVAAMVTSARTQRTEERAMERGFVPEGAVAVA